LCSSLINEAYWLKLHGSMCAIASMRAALLVDPLDG
jgi:hypothetical protein